MTCISGATKVVGYDFNRYQTVDAPTASSLPALYSSITLAARDSSARCRPQSYLKIKINLISRFSAAPPKPSVSEATQNTAIMGQQPKLYAFGNSDSLAKSLRTYILHCQGSGFERHDAFKVAVSGGSLPKTLAKALLAPGNGSPEDTVDFSKWEIFFADERAVPLDHDDSNYKLLKDELLNKIPSNMGQPTVHTIDVQHMDDVQEMADQYQDSLLKSFAAKDSVKTPIFDLLLLGCGPDGHTCSLFPGHELLRESDAWVASIEDSPKPPAKRITLTLPVVTHAAKIAFVATGDGKKEILKKILDTEEGRSLPCGLVNEGGAERVSWFTDHAAVDGVGFPRRGSL